MSTDHKFTVVLSKNEIESIIRALRSGPEWDTPSRLPIITKLERRLRQIKTDLIERAKYEGPDYLVGI